MADKKVLLVEGIDDEKVFEHLCRNRGGPLIDTITVCKNVEQLLKHFPIRLKQSDITSLGVVVDADDKPTSRWQSLRDRLSEAGYKDIPDKPLLDGTILDRPSEGILPRVGIWIMPDNRNTGILEDFLLFLVPDGSKLFTHVRSSVATIPPEERRFGPQAEPKAIIHTWLAWQKDPGKPLGTAITAKFLDPNVPQVDVLMSWLDRLFE